MSKLRYSPAIVPLLRVCLCCLNYTKWGAWGEGKVVQEEYCSSCFGTGINKSEFKDLFAFIKESKEGETWVAVDGSGTWRETVQILPKGLFLRLACNGGIKWGDFSTTKEVFEEEKTRVTRVRGIQPEWMLWSFVLVNGEEGRNLSFNPVNEFLAWDFNKEGRVRLYSETGNIYLSPENFDLSKFISLISGRAVYNKLKLTTTKEETKDEN